ncbi:MAG: hypothetical protein PHU04_00925 [Candidatus Peribacteraceae bacterium]|nr:hypothetical protein [Candidatus Peribacteraceae bacterium]
MIRYPARLYDTVIDRCRALFACMRDTIRRRIASFTELAIMMR